MASVGDKDWPKWSKPALALAAMIFLGGIWIGVPLLSAFKLVDHNVRTSGVVDYRPMMSVLIAMTTATIAGIFLFMTLRIDRGTKLKAGRAARKEAKRRADEFFGEETTKLVRETVQAEITEDALRGHVEAVLMLDVNVEILRKYVDEHVQELDVAAVERIVGALKEVTSHLSRRLPEGRKEGAGFFARVTRRFRK